MSRKPRPLFADPVRKHVAGMRTLLGVIQAAAAARDCPATREAIEEMEDRGEVGCPLCGAAAALHRDDDRTPDQIADDLDAAEPGNFL